jgi:hypothetical protein
VGYVSSVMNDMDVRLLVNLIQIDVDTMSLSSLVSRSISPYASTFKRQTVQDE